MAPRTLCLAALLCFALACSSTSPQSTAPDASAIDSVFAAEAEPEPEPEAEASSDSGPGADGADADASSDSGPGAYGAGADVVGRSPDADVAVDVELSETVADAASDNDSDSTPEPEPGPDVPLPAATVSRIVMAGDSWSTGLVFPTIGALSDLGYADVTLTWEGTALAGSRAAEWVANDEGKLDALTAALDAEPPAEILLLVLGGNDMNKAAVDDDLGKLPTLVQDSVLDGIRDDLQWLVDFALKDRPHLQVAIIGYDYLHYELLNAFISLDGFDTKSYNEILVALETRKRDLALATERCHYAHNLGLLQNVFGDVPHPPFLLPPFAYDPGFLPAPGWAPAYEPFPGGSLEVPAPLDHMPDGIHPSEQGFRVIIDHSFAQGLENLVKKAPW